jgi:cyclase
MYRPRIIPVLLLKGTELVKTVGFQSPNYIGDPINAVHLFNSMKADELVFLDINASKENRLVNIELMKEVGDEANMPFAVGGGINTLNDIQLLISAGAEKVILGTAAGENPLFVKEASEAFGSSTIAVCIDVKRSWFGKQKVWISNGTRSIAHDPVTYAKLMEEMGAGELIIQSVERDGKMNGYDQELIRAMSSAVRIPVVALGGAKTLDDMKSLHSKCTINGLAAGSLFVYQGNNKGVLINYPDRSTIQELFRK